MDRTEELHEVPDEPTYQGRWEFVVPKPVRKMPERPRRFIDIEAFKRFIAITQRPVDQRLGDRKGE